MDYNKEKIENNKVKLSFSIEGEKWEDALQRAYFKTKGQYRIEGFRKGHAPRKMIEAQYGKNAFFEDAIDILLQECYDYVLDNDKEFEPVASPSVSLDGLSEKGVKFSITVTCKPDVVLGAYKGLDIQMKVDAVSDEQVEAEVERARERAASWAPVTDRAVADGDKVNINYSGSVNGVKFEGGTAENQDLIIGSHSFIPGMEEGMIGMNVGETKDLEVTFPAEYHEKSLAGKPSVFEVKINSIDVKILPELDDEFAKDLGEYDTLAEYKASIRKNLEDNAKSRAERIAEDEMFDKICANANIDVPQEMIDSRLDNYVKDFDSRLQQQGMDIKKYYEYTGSDEKALREQYKESAEKSVKTSLVLDAIVAAEKIEADAEEFDRLANAFASSYGIESEEFSKMLAERSDLKEYINNQAVTETAIKFLKKNNNIA